MNANIQLLNSAQHSVLAMPPPLMTSFAAYESPLYSAAIILTKLSTFAKYHCNFIIITISNALSRKNTAVDSNIK